MCVLYVAVPYRLFWLRISIALLCSKHHITELPLRAGAYIRSWLVRYSYIYKAQMSPALNRCSDIGCFKHSDAIKIRDRIIFNFYMGLSHTYILPASTGLRACLLTECCIWSGVCVCGLSEGWYNFCICLAEHCWWQTWASNTEQHTVTIQVCSLQGSLMSVKSPYMSFYIKR